MKVLFLMSHWMFSCQEVSRKVSESMDRKLPWHHRLLMNLHLVMCKYCRRFKDQLLIMHRALNCEDLSPDEASSCPHLSRQACERIKQALQDRLPEDRQ